MTSPTVTDKQIAGSGERYLLAVDEGGSAIHPLEGRLELVIGRGEECDIRIDKPWVSRRHVKIEVGEQIAVEDLKSANGTRVGGRSLAGGEVAVLRLGDTLELGSSLLVLRASAATLPREGSTPGPRANAPKPIVASSARMEEILRLVDRFASGRINVLLEGETGVGKEVIAGLLHQKSPRASGPFLRLNCAAFSEPLLESELFGHERGAFTGAAQTKPGLLETASGGTVFLDEVGELPLGLQAKLLRVLEDREVRRVGGLKPIALDVRFVSATNRRLEDETAAKRFREDLYFRLNGATITIPPLRERLEELEGISLALLAQTREPGGPPPPAIAPDAKALLARHRWPGNIRELRNVLERAVLLSGGEAIRAEHLQLRVEKDAPAGAPRDERGDDDLKGQLAQIERTRILAALATFSGNQTQAAKHLGISRKVLIARIEAYGIERPRKGK